MNGSRVLLTLSTVSLTFGCVSPVVDDAANAHDSTAEVSAESNIAVTTAALTADENRARQDQLAASVNAQVVPLIPSQPRLWSIRFKGEPFTMIKNWDFGTDGNIRGYRDLTREFQFHDQFGTIANGTNYGAVTVASNSDTAVTAPGLGLPDDRQPVENLARPTRQWTATSMLAHVRPLSPSQSSVSASRHDLGNGSITSKWALPKGGSQLGHDIVWETRLRMPKQAPGYWLALWTAGKRWDKGAEMDVLESFGTQYVRGDAFHADSVGGTNLIDFTNWFAALDQVGVSTLRRQLSDWHMWTWVYLRDDTYEIYYDGTRVQQGSIHWTYRGDQLGEPLDMSFLFDFSWGHTLIPEVNVELPASSFPVTYEVDYSRVYIR